MLRVGFFEEGASCFINGFAVIPAFRGRGLGRQILMETVRKLLAEPCPRIRIEVDTGNLVALSLYRSCGFEEIASYRYYQMQV